MSYIILDMRPLFFISPFLLAAPALAQPQEVRLTDFLAQVESRFPKLQGLEAERLAATAKRLSKEGAFDPQLSTSTELLRYNSASARGKASYGAANELGVEVALPSGLKLAAGRNLNTGSVKSPNSSTGSEGTYFLYGKLPLARGSGLNEKAALLTQAQLAEPASQQSLLLVRQGSLLEASQLYWEWAGASAKLQIAQNLLNVAQFRAAAIRTEFEQKQRSRFDVTEAEAEVDRRQTSQIKAQRDLEKVALKLAKYLWDGRAVESLRAEPLPTPQLPVESELTTARQRALDLRPELKLIALEKASQRVSERLAQNDLQPAVDLVFSPGADLGNKGVGEVYKLGVSASIPLYQREARGRRDEARQKQLKLEREEELIQRQIDLELRDAASALQRAVERFRAADENVRKSQLLVEGERINFREGDGTLFLINQRERAAAEAESLRVDIQIEFVQAQAALRAASMGF